MQDVLEKVALRFNVNGEAVRVAVAPDATLLDVLRDDLELTGAKLGCGEGECGACSVILDGRVVNSCLVLALECDGSSVLTIEGLRSDGKLHPLQKAFVDCGAIQCGFCSPGMIMAAYALIEVNPSPTESDVQRALEGNLCRCTGYRPIYDALESLGAPAEDDAFLPKLKQEAPNLASFGIHTHTPEGERAFHRHADLQEVFHELGKHPDAKLIAGGTDALVEANQSHRREPVDQAWLGVWRGP